MKTYHFNLVLLIALFTYCGGNVGREKERAAQSDTIIAVTQRNIRPFLINFQAKELKKVIDSLAPLVESGTPRLKFYWLELNETKYRIENKWDSVKLNVWQRQKIAVQNNFPFEDIISLKAALAEILMSQNRYDSAIQYGLEGYYIGHKHNFVSTPLNFKLFEMYSAIGDRDNARKYLFEGYAHCSDKSYFKVYFSAGLAQYYEENNQPDSALYYFRYVEKDTVFTSRAFEASKYENIGVLLTSNQQPVEGLPYLLKSLPIHREVGSMNGMTMLNVAITYSKLGQFQPSFQYLDSAMLYGDTLHDISLVRQIWDLKAQNFVGLKNYKEGFLAKDSANRLYKKELDTLTAKKGRELETRYALKEKEEKITSLNQANEVQQKLNNQRKIIIISLSIVLLLLIAVSVLLWRRKQFQIQIREAKSKQRLLRSQMEPHFIFNTLSVLQSFLQEEKAEKSIDFLSRFSKLLRISLENAQEDFVPLQKELEALRNYLELHTINFDYLFDFNLQVHLDLEKYQVLIPPMLLQPFVENAIYHGFTNINQRGMINITIDKKDNTLYCVIEDNGIGLQNPIEPSQRRSLSTVITEERLAILSKQTKIKSSIRIIDKASKGEESGVRVMMEIPFIEKI